MVNRRNLGMRRKTRNVLGLKKKQKKEEAFSDTQTHRRRKLSFTTRGRHKHAGVRDEPGWKILGISVIPAYNMKGDESY